MEYAGFWRRLVGEVFIDLPIVGIASLLYDAAIGDVSGLLIGPAYFIGFWTGNGQTPGKMVMGVRIVKRDGSAIGFGCAVLRYLGQIVSGILLCIGYLMIAWDRRKQGLHDKIAGTCVIKTR